MEKIKFKDLEWYVLEKDEENIKLLLVNVLDEEHIKKYVDDEWYRDGYKVRHSSDIRANVNGWEDSYIKNVVLENFKKDLGIDCEVTLLTKEEALNLNKEVGCCNDWYWTKTVIENNTYLYFANVYGNDHSISYNASNSDGVRPVLSTKISNLAFDSENKVPDKLGEYVEVSNDLACEWSFAEKKLKDKVNEIIDYLKSKENK